MDLLKIEDSLQLKIALNLPSTLFQIKPVFNPFQPSIAFHIETSHLICTTNQMTGCYMKCKAGLKCIKVALLESFLLTSAEVSRKLQNNSDCKCCK